MTVLSALQSAAPYIGVAVPTALFSGTDRTSIELQECVNESARGIVEDFDWQRFKKVATITGDGSEEDWDFPSDYFRMLKLARLWPSDEPNTSLVHIQSEDDWLRDEVQAFSSVVKRWIIYGNQFHIKPALESGATVKHFYISNKIVLAAGDVTPTKTAFTADTDSFALDERLLKLAIVWRWKASRGRAYAEDLESYNNARDILAGTDKGSRVLHVGSNRVPSDVTIAWPGVLG